MSEFELKILRPEDSDLILSFERRRLKSGGLDEVEQELQAWSARWRPEALTHYLSLGWSFAAHAKGDEARLRGYFLAQPLLFFRGFTQTLWLEHLSYDEPLVGQSLVELAYRWARDKHMQKVIFPDQIDVHSWVEPFKGRSVQEPWIELSATRIK